MIKLAQSSNKDTRGMCKICLISFPNQLTFLNNGNFGLKWSEFKDKETKTKLPKLN